MKVHFIAIGGSAMHNLAIALYKKGFQISGSDDHISEPSMSRLSKFGLLPKPGWDVEKITSDLDAVILGMHATTDNPELLEAQKKGIKIYSYPEYVYAQSKEKTRIVIGGSHGKTTITSMILHVLKEAGKDFDYLVGAQLEGFDTMVKITEDAPLIVIEGDEYLSSPIDRRPKFHLYQANIGLISGIAWDHVNVFPTFENYVRQFEVFIDTIRPKGKLIYCEADETLKTMVENYPAKLEKIPYSLPLHQVKDGITSLIFNNKKYPLQVFGDHNLLNIEAAKTVCKAIGVEEETFYKSISTFKGASKRLELIGSNQKTNIYKDFAHSPSKLSATIKAVKEQFPDRKLVACIELHTFSSLNKNFLKEYAGTMALADEAIVFIDKNTFLQKNMEPYAATVVKEAFARENLIFYDDPTLLFYHLKQLNYKDTNLLLMSSGTFGGTDLSQFVEIIL